LRRLWSAACLLPLCGGAKLAGCGGKELVEEVKR
jgi:hypothetical protein